MKFEESLKELQEIVTKLESGELSLENALKLYQDGIELSVSCKKQLESAKLKVQQLSEAE